ncbi:MAG TPA: caspase family protein [Bradyrhizobium sp.]|nr:caspase family protein [Bradyrhizobium sp.]
MSPIKGTFLAASLLAGLLAAGPAWSAPAQRPATEAALMDQSTPSQPPAQRSLLSVEKPANAGKPVGLGGPEQRIALVIGNSNYQNVTQLSNPDNDAKSVAQLLNAAGFEVILATDVSHNEMIQVVQDFSGKIADRGPNTVAMVYYAGHGVQLAGENYLVPVDARISSEPDLINGSVRLVDVMATLDAIPSRMRIAILDACRNNPFPSLNDAGRGLAIVDAPNGSIVAYSTAPGTEALDGIGDHSPYTAAFLRLAHEKNLPIEQLFKRVRLEVNNSTGGQQTPWESSSLTSDFYFFGDTAVAATKAPAQEQTVYTADNLPSRASRQAYDYVLAENSVEHYQEFIERYPNDPLCYRIRALLASLVQAKAWHNAVLANSPVAYQSFYDKFSNGPYAQSALKLAVQPKMIPLSRPTQIMTPPSIKLGHGSQIVTLRSPGTNASFGNSNAAAGKIVNLPGSGLNKMGAPQTTKLDGAAKHMDGRPTKLLSQSRINQRPSRVSRSNFGMPPRRTGRNFSMASTQLHGSSFRPQFRSGGGGFGGGGFGGGGFGRR